MNHQAIAAIWLIGAITYSIMWELFQVLLNVVPIIFVISKKQTMTCKHRSKHKRLVLDIMNGHMCTGMWEVHLLISLSTSIIAIFPAVIVAVHIPASELQYKGKHCSFMTKQPAIMEEAFKKLASTRACMQRSADTMLPCTNANISLVLTPHTHLRHMQIMVAKTVHVIY